MDYNRKQILGFGLKVSLFGKLRYKGETLNSLGKD
jgi:hypothetical protein